MSSMTRPPFTAHPGFERGGAFIGDRYVPIDEASIPILDTGFARSDVTYDVVALWNGQLFRLEDHLDRFEASCRALRLVLPHSREKIIAVVSEIIRRTALQEAYVEVICTRGVPRNGGRDPRAHENRFYAFAIPYVWILPEEQANIGMDVVVAQSVRRIPATSVDPTVKNFHWGDLTRGLFEAYDRGAHFCVLLDAEGHVTEGPGYNVFSLRGDRLATPDTGVLEGVTRRTVLELAAAEGIDAEIRSITEREFRDADELFACSTAGGVMPITSVDGRPVGDGSVGRVTERLRKLYWAAHDDPRYVTPIDYRAP